MTCTHCSIDKLASMFYFKDKSIGRMDSVCIECRRATSKSYRENNKLALAANRAQYYQRNKAERVAYINEWGKKNADKVKKYKQRYEDNNQEKLKATRKKYQQNNSEKELEKNRRQIENLNPGYIKNKLKRQGFTDETITPEIILIKQLLIKNKRKWLTKR